MRVFISWSGERSHSVAIALKTFIGDIVQSVTPFVSDEDIINGERWNNRLQEELKENQYGILSITHDNKESPWLLFEAGALSNSSSGIPVVPFLFDIEPSELTGSPLLQFQATIYYNEENLKKLANEINDACGEDKLDNMRLERAFSRCYPEFVSALKKIKPESVDSTKEKSDKTHAILEEVLDITRNNQKLLSVDSLSSSIAERIDYLLDKRTVARSSKSNDLNQWRDERKYNAMILDDIIRLRKDKFPIPYVILIALSYFKDDVPWLYDIGKNLLDYIQSDNNFSLKKRAIIEFESLIEFSSLTPMLQESSKDRYMLIYELPRLYINYLDAFSLSKDENRDKEHISHESNSRQRINTQSKKNNSDDK